MYIMYTSKRTLWYTIRMDVPITQFRRNIFALVNQALEGREVWFTHKGRRLKIVPEGKPVSRLSRITPMQIINNDDSCMDDDALLAEMTRAWEADWDRDFGPAPDLQTSPRKAGREP
jgi:hypothetical protein